MGRHLIQAVQNSVQPAPARYQSQRVNPLALGVVLAVHALLIALVLTYRFAVADGPSSPPRLVTMNLTPPPAPPENVVTPPPENTPIYAPRPLIILPVPTQPVQVTVDEPPPRQEPVSQAPAAPAAPPTPVSSPAPSPPQQVSGGDLSSTMIHAPKPRYPVESRRKREQGTVQLTLVLGTDGRVASVRVSRSSGHSRLDEAALKAVRNWRWSPTLRDGVPVQVTGTLALPFELAG